MKRLFFLVPNLQMTAAIVTSLEEMGIKDADIHIAGNKESTVALKKAHLPEASIIQTSDLLPALKRGALIGLAFAAALYLTVIFTIPAKIAITPIAIVAIIFFGILFGAWTSTLIGVSVKDPILAENKKYIKNGYFILMIDCEDDKENELIKLILSFYPQAEIAGVTSK